MKRLILSLIASFAACSLWAFDSVIVAPVKALTDGGKYYIYDAYGDDGTTNEQAGANDCRYAFRYDNEGPILGDHIKPANAYRTNPLDNSHVWKAVKSGDNWKFQNVATNKWFGTTDQTADEGTALTLEPTSTPGTFKVVVPGTNSRWDGSEIENFPFCYWSGTGHPYQFYQATTTNNGSSYTLYGRNGWHVQFSLPGNDMRQVLVPEGDDARDYLPKIDFCTLTITGTTNTIVSGNNRRFDVSVTENFPFRASYNLNNATYQAWFMHSTYADKDTRYTITYTPNDDEANVTATRQGVTTTAHPDAELWAFVGDRTNGYRIYNKVAGSGKVLTKGDEYATLATEVDPDKSLWLPVVSASNPDQTKYFTFKNKYDSTVFLNLQWKAYAEGEEPVGIFKFWNAADQGSTAWVEGMSQPLVDPYVISANRPAIKGVVGDYADDNVAQQAAATAQQANAELAKLNVYGPITSADLAKVNQLKNQLEAYRRLQFDPTKTYRLYNCQYEGYLKLSDESTFVGGGTTDDNTVITFAKGSSNNTYLLLCDVYYLGFVTRSTTVNATEYEDEAGEFELSVVGEPFEFGLKGGEDMDDQYTYLHEDAQHNIVGWLNNERPSKWLLVPTSPINQISEVTSVGSKNDAIYDLQGRRVAAPTSGLYIINGNKVIVK